MAAVAAGACLFGAIACASAQPRRRHVAAVRMEVARATAVRLVPGQVVATELEREHGRWIYSFEIRPTGETGRHVREVNIDADRGTLVGLIEDEVD